MKWGLFLTLLGGCTGPSDSDTVVPEPDTEPPPPLLADVVSVVVSAGETPVMTVGVRSPDVGCARYADWWEVITDSGELVYRRTVEHSHVNEQPFVRNGGPIEVDRDTVLWVRAHLHPDGYGGAAWTGTLNTGLGPTDEQPPVSDVEDLPPQPVRCAF